MKYDDEKILRAYSSNWKEWVDIAKRQAFVSRYLFPEVLSYFDKNNSILELGAGVGQLSMIAEEKGYDIVGSDYCPEFVQYMSARLKHTKRVDAQDILGDTSHAWSGIFTQGLSVLVTKDIGVIQKTYESIFEALEPGGRFVFIFPRADRSRYSRMEEHRGVYIKAGFKEIALFRQQMLPAPLYKYGAARLVEYIFGRYLGIRDIIVLGK